METIVQVPEDELAEYFRGKIKSHGFSVTYNGRSIPIPLFTEIANYQTQIKELTERVEQLEEEKSKVIVVEEMSYEDAKKKVLELLKKNKEGYYSTEIAQMLNMDISVVLKIISELKENDKIDLRD